MAEVFPDNDFMEINISLQHTIFSSKTRGGLVAQVRVADPFWVGDMTTVPYGLNEKKDIQLWESFLQDCIDRNLSIDFVNPMYPCPVSYTVANFPGSQTGTITAFPSGRTLTVTGLATGLILKRGDRLSIEQGNRIMHYMIAADQTLGASPQTITITPRLRTGLFTTGAIVRLVGAKMRLRISPNTVTMPLRGGDAVAISFSVYENGA